MKAPLNPLLLRSNRYSSQFSIQQHEPENIRMKQKKADWIKYLPSIEPRDWNLFKGGEGTVPYFGWFGSWSSEIKIPRVHSAF